MSTPIQVLIADDHPLFRVGLKYALKAQGFDVTAEASDGRQAVSFCETHHPNVVLLDVKMPHMDGIEACRHIVSRDLCALVIMLTTFEEPAIIHAARVAGATAYLSKETDPAELARAIRGIVERPNHNWLPRISIPTLTQREAQVLDLLAVGCSNKEIAKQLGLSPETVKDYVNGVYRKLDVRDRVGAVNRARALGLI
jgi:two-component system nitrate/nitrite response regulator NarL